MIRKIVNILDRCFMSIALLCILLIMLLTSIDMLLRWIFHISIPSLFEFTEDYLMVGLVFLSLSYVYSIGGHIRVSFLDKIIPAKIHYISNIVSKLLGCGLFVLIAYEGWLATLQAIEYNEMSSGLIRYPMAPALVLVPLGSALLSVRIVLSIFDGSLQGDSSDEDID